MKYLKHAKLAIIPSVWGHVAGGGGGDPEDAKWMEKEVSEFISS